MTHGWVANVFTLIYDVLVATGSLYRWGLDADVCPYYFGRNLIMCGPTNELLKLQAFDESVIIATRPTI